MNSVTTTATTTASTAASPAIAGSSSMPDIRKAYPVMISRMNSTTRRPGSRGHGRARDQSPQPSTSGAPAGHGAGVVPPASKRGRFVGSPAPRLADPLPRMASASYAPDHEAFKDVSLHYKDNVMRLRVHRGAAAIEFAPRPSSEGTKLKMSEWNLVCKARDTVDFHMSSHDKSGEDVRVWVLLKDRRDGGVAYLTVKPFRGQMYVHIRDYWFPNGRDGGLAPTSRGVTLNHEGWNTLVQEMDTMDELWRDANEYLECQSAIRRAPSTLVDTQDEEYSQLVILDD